ncbi:glycoside hydrolase family 2 TIM barrel-domain containing protein [Colwelliaceae bacterium BS250]
MNNLHKLVIAILALIVIVVGLEPFSQESKTGRLNQNINRDWQFTFSSATDVFTDAASKQAKAANWQSIGLPHSFSLPYFRSESFYVGHGWYQKSLHIDKNWLSKTLTLEFDGVFQVAEIYLNGEKVGAHRGGYTGFTVDISNAAKAGENLLAVQVNNVWDAQLAPRAGEHVFSGGIYRDVYLSVTDPLHVAWNGTFVTTPKVSKESANVNVQTTIENNSNSSKQFTLKTVIVDGENKQLAEMIVNKTIEAKQTINLEQLSDEISQPKLWSPDSPSLYQVQTSIYENDTLVDSYQTQFGFRWVEWTADKGFFLNGEHLYLEGVNVHQDHAGWGDAVTKAGVYRDLKLMKDAGFNFIRGSHYPHHPYFTQVCDELGLMFIPENSIWGIGGFKDDGYWDSSTYPIHQKDKLAYELSAAASLKELILINRNSPSVIAWSMSNEPFFSANEVIDDMKGLLTDMVDLSHRLDPTRKAMIGGAQRKGVDVLGDIAGYNGDGATRDRDPGMPNMVSEYGSCVTDRPGDYDACWSSHLKGGEKPEWRSGHAIWCGFDHGSIAGNMGEMGIVDFARIPKRIWYWYRNYFKGIAPPKWPENGTPTSLKLFADKTTLQGTNATDDAHINVQVLDASGTHISNSPSVTLTIVSGPGEFPTGRSITFNKTTRNDIQILDGHAAIEFRSYHGGVTVIEATSPGLESAQLEITTIGSPMFEKGVSKIVQDRPYIDYRLTKAIKEQVPVRISDARPNRTNDKGSSDPAWANDGHKWRQWEPVFDKNGKNGQVWWELDMENFYDVQRVEFTFKPAADVIINIETSTNQKDWIPVANGEFISGSVPNITFDVEDKTKVRFLKVTFNVENTSVPFGVGEIEVFGSTN